MLDPWGALLLASLCETDHHPPADVFPIQAQRFQAQVTWGFPSRPDRAIPGRRGMRVSMKEKDQGLPGCNLAH